LRAQGLQQTAEIARIKPKLVAERPDVRAIGANLENTPAAAAISTALAGLLGSAKDLNQSASSATVSDFRGHQAVLEDFLAAIRQDRAPACDGLEGRRSLALIETIYRAAKTPDRLSTVGPA